LFKNIGERRAERRIGRRRELARDDIRDGRSSDWFEARESARSEPIGRAGHRAARRSRCAQRDANNYYTEEVYSFDLWFMIQYFSQKNK
jgi:hypothetical protein